MVLEEEREYGKFTTLKTIESEKVTEQNAQQMLEDAKNKIMKQLKKLDVRNVTEVENLYLIVARLTQAASHVAAINKAERKRTSFAQEIGIIGVDDINPILLDAFKDHPEAVNLQKISLIDDVYKPSKQAWAGLHGRMEIVANATKAYNILRVLTETLPAYQEHLENKLRNNGVDIPLPKEMPVDTSSIVNKMVTRYQAVLDLRKRIENKKSLTAPDMKFAEIQIKKCLDNRPDWTERSFLQKLTDVLSFGIKPLFRGFFSKEKEFQKTMEQSIEPPKMES